MMRRWVVAAGGSFALGVLGATPAIGGPAGGRTGAQQRETIQRIVLVCEHDHAVECPADPEDPGYTIPGNQFDRIFHTSCGSGNACVPDVQAEVAGTLTVAATERAASPGASCAGDPSCIGLDVVVELALPGSPAPFSFQRTFTHGSGFLRSTVCAGDNTSPGVRIADWFPFRSRDCVFDLGINFEGMLLAGNPTYQADVLARASLLELEAALLEYAREPLGFPVGSVLPTTLLDQASATLLPGNAVKLNADAGQIVGATRTVTWTNVPIRFALARPAPVAESAKLLEPAPPFGRFGAAVAVAGDVAVVGSPTDVSFNPSDPGAAWAFRPDGASWVADARIEASDRQAGDQFGGAVDVSGNRVVVGMANFATGGTATREAAYVFRWDGAAWVQEAKLVAPGPAGFGLAVALDDDVAVVGAPRTTVGGVVQAGAAYVFRRGASGWSLQQTLTRADALPGARLGTAVDVSDGRIVVTALRPFVYRWDGASWIEEPTFVPPWSPVAAALDGERAALGSPLVDDESGAAYVTRYDAGAWISEQTVQIEGVPPFQWLGSSVGLSGDLLVGGSQITSGGGAAYAFRRFGGAWWQEAKLQPVHTAASWQFTPAVDVDRARVVVGDPIGTGPNGAKGAAYLFELPAAQVDISGIATGGSVGLGIRDYDLSVPTSGGEPADTVAGAIAAAVNADPFLATLGIGAARDGARLLIRRVDASEVSLVGADAGLSLVLVTECNDGDDDDGDGRVDAADPGCADPSDLSERTPLYACDDGADNDFDGAADFPADVGCRYPDSTRESPQCQDGVDNDGDGRIDFDGGASRGVSPPTLPDAQCFAAGQYVAWDNRERPGCGIGFELALVLPGIRSLLARTRRRRLAKREAA
jgi:hypothetical protein